MGRFETTENPLDGRGTGRPDAPRLPRKLSVIGRAVHFGTPHPALRSHLPPQWGEGRGWARILHSASPPHPALFVGLGGAENLFYWEMAEKRGGNTGMLCVLT